MIVAINPNAGLQTLVVDVKPELLQGKKERNLKLGNYGFILSTETTYGDVAATMKDWFEHRAIYGAGTCPKSLGKLVGFSDEFIKSIKQEVARAYSF